jgi:uncharacterized protein YbjT (DUF2867 family)
VAEAGAQPDPAAKTVAIAGATGFVGRALCAALAGRYRVVALTRGEPRTAPGPAVEWRRCDLFSLREVEAALAGADAAVYLVHSMLPSARLVQGRFEDLDLVLADNFARAAERAGVRQLVYLGGMVPEQGALSPHLRSRLEVEEALGSRAPALSALRAGIVVGPGSASLWILVNLVRRLPLMVLPSWCDSRSQPVALADVVRAVELCLEEPGRFTGSFDVAGPDVLSYREMMQRTARVLGLRRAMIRVRAFSPRLSKLWVRVFGSAPASLVNPLVESLRHDLVARESPLLAALRPRALGFEAALRAALGAGGRPQAPSSSLRLPRADRARLRRARTVRSVQRLPLPPGRDAAWAAEEYLRFLPRTTRPWIRVESAPDGHCRFRLAGLRRPLLVLRLARERSAPDRQVFDVVGGLLARTGEGGVGGRLEFREARGGRALLAAIHDYRPALPFALYEIGQARVHLWVMRRFARHLRDAAARPA